VSAIRVAGLVVAAILSGSSLTGCGSIYLHSEASKEATANAKTELDKVDVGALFDNEAAYLDELEKRENAAVAESLGARRDRELLRVMRGVPADDGGDGRVYLGLLIDNDLNSLVGVSDRAQQQKFSAVIADGRLDVTKGKAPAAAFADAFAAKGNQLGAGSALERAIAAALQREKARQGKEEEARKAIKELNDDMDAAAKEMSEGNRNQDKFGALLAKLNDFLKKAKDAGNPYVGEYISEAFGERLDELIRVTDPKDLDGTPDTKTRATIAFVHALYGVGDAFSNPPRVPHPNALAVAQAWLRYEASHAEIELKEARSMEAAHTTRLLALTERIYHLSLAGQELESIARTPKPEENKGLSRLLNGNDVAANRAASAALYHYASAWNRGAIPVQQVDEVTVALIERRAKLQQSRKAGEVWLGALKPAVATLAAYGEGGLDPKVLADLLQVLGVGAIAVGVN
jgi:hypothetical protein